MSTAKIFRNSLLPLAAVSLLGCLVGCGDGRSDPGVTGSPTPTAAASPSPVVCPTSVTLAINGAGVDLDAGTTGVNYDTHFNEGDALTLTVSCAESTTSDCGTCGLTATATSGTSRRCLHDTRRRCARDDDCPGSRCADLLGSPLPLTNGGTPSCVLNEVVTAGPGTYVPTAGDLTVGLHLRWTFFLGLDAGMPCPRCSGSALGESGICDGGEHDGAPCTVDGTEPLLGNTSHDCPPNPSALLTTFDLPMSLATGTSTLEPVEHCTEVPFAGLPCFCVGQASTNECRDGLCEEGSDGDGICTRGPTDGSCVIDSFRGCKSDADCPGVGDHCAGHLRECSANATGTEGHRAPLIRVGRASATTPLLVSTFCVQSTTFAVFDLGLGLPAPAAIRLPVVLR